MRTDANTVAHPDLATDHRERVHGAVRSERQIPGQVRQGRDVRAISQRQPVVAVHGGVGRDEHVRADRRPVRLERAVPLPLTAAFLGIGVVLPRQEVDAAHSFVVGLFHVSTLGETGGE